jgi:putative pyridoxal-dependent aspartate 1-decarboxylase
LKTTEQFLTYLDNLDIKLWLDGDRLRCNAPKDALTSELKAELQTRKQEILHLFRKINSFSIPDRETITPVSRAESIPLSFAQQRLWFLAQLEPESPFYNESSALKLNGQLNIPILKQSLEELIGRHEPLRTTFSNDLKGQPVQIIYPTAEISLPIINLEQLNSTARQQEIEKLVTQEAQKVFNLEQDLLFRITLLRLNSSEHIVLITTHHIITDGWSIGILIQELSSLYSAFCAGESSPLPELPIQYADFAVWQRQWLSGKVLDTQLSYWQQQLQGIPELLQLPTDRPRPRVQTHRGATQSFTLDTELSQKLQALSRKSGSTLFMTLLAAFATLLYRYSGQTDILIGSPIANRNRSEIESLIGFFVNTLVLRTHFEDNPQIEELLARVRETTLKAYEHQDVPFERVVGALSPQRSLSHSPLFQVMFILQNAPSEEVELPGVTLTHLELESTIAKFELTLSISETDRGLEGEWEYNTDLFEPATIERMTVHWQNLLSAMVANPQQRVSELPLLTESERHQLLVEWNNTEEEYPQKCLHQLFEEQVEKTPDAVAVVFEDQQLTYRQLNAKANQLARYLQHLGVKPEMLVGICVERSLEMVIGLLAILKAGGVYVPLDPHYPQERLSYMIADSGVAVLLTQSSLLPSLPEHQAQIVHIDTDGETIGQYSQDNLEVGVGSENLAYVIYTSGSTGKPKGVMNAHQGIVNRLLWMQDAYQLTSSDRVLQKTPFSFDVSVWEFFWTLMTGATIVLAKPEGHKDSNYLVDLIARQQITTIHFVPSMLQVFLQEPNLEKCSCLKQVFCSGEPLPWKLTQRFFAQLESQLHNLYGPTEAAIDVTYWQCQPQDKLQLVPIGRPIANTQIYLLDKNLQPVPIGVAGELHIGGKGLARGYLNRTELTQEKFIPNPFAPSLSEKLYKTGDLARYLPALKGLSRIVGDTASHNGNIEYLGRIDRQVKIRGFRIELGEIEAILDTHPQIQQAVVTAREDIPGNQCLVAYIVTQKDALNGEQLREFLKQKLPEYMVPNIFVTLDMLPLAPNGKVDKKALPAPDSAINRQHEYVAPRNQSEEIIANIFGNVLGVPNVGIHDNFFELGGHSLLATQLISRLRVVFELEIPLRAVFESPTVAQLERAIKQLSATKSGLSLPPIQPRTEGEQLPLSWAQERLWFLNQLESSATYNMPEAIRITGMLNINALQQALSEIVRRHEILRTSFSTIGDRPIQIIHSEATLKIEVVDLQQLKAKRETALQQKIQQEATTPFDLEFAPLIRCSLLQLDNREYVLLLTMHHIVSDGWSMGRLIQELSSLYRAFCAGESSPLPELSIQYADFAVWQRQWLSGKVLDTQLSYWQQQLQGVPELLQLPTDRPRPRVQAHQGATQSFTLDTELSQKLQALSRKSGSTLFMTLLAAFATLLYRYSGQTDILIGSPIANRNRSEIESLIGFFVNTLVLRTHFEDNPQIEELLARVRETTLKAYEHQDVPFERVVGALSPQRSLSHSPLFQVMFILQNAPSEEVELPGVTLTHLELESTIAKFELTLSITETDRGLEGEWEYNTDLFEGSTIERMTVHWQNLLSAMVANPQQRVSELPLLTASERQQLLVEWNNTEEDYPQKCLHQLFEEQVEKTPDAVAVVFEDQQLTYRQLNARANQLARYLQHLGVKPEMLVGICVEPSLEQVVSILSVLKANAAYVPLDVNYPPERLAFMLEDSNVHILITRQSLREKISPQQAHIVCLDRDRDAIARESFANLNCQTTPDNLAYAIYTSGSTGRPKAVLGKIHSIVNRLNWMWRTLPFAADEVCCQKTSINFIDHVAEIFSPLLKGIALVIVPDDIRKDISQLISLLSDREITRIVLVPSLLKVILDSGPQQLLQLKHLKYVFCSGEALPLTLAEAFYQKLSSARLFNLYGSSEVAADVTCFEVNFWEIRQRILQYFKPEIVHSIPENQNHEERQQPFTKPGVSPEMLATKFQRSELPLYPVTVDDYYDKFTQEVLPYAIDTSSPTFIGHMTSALPDFMHDLSKMISRLNQNLVKIETSKSLIFLEREAIAMLHRLVYGFSGEFYTENIQRKNHNLGIITTGGTTANISALLCARNSGLLSQENSDELSKQSLYKVLKRKGYEDIVIIGSRLMHYSFTKAASVLGLGTDNIIFIDSNRQGNLDLNLLPEKIRECRRNKLYILAIVGIAGTTETGEIDSLGEMGEIARKFGIHFHVDGAWGGATIFSEKHKEKLKGIDKADSITICGHKQLYLPQGISVCLFKDPQMLTFAETTARYQAQRDTFDVGRFTIEGSRSALSLCLHGALHIIGKKGYEILIDNGIEKARYFARAIELLEPFELVIQPTLNIVNYRYVPDDLRVKATQKSLSDGDIQRINRLNTQIQKEQFERGMTFVSKTTLIDTVYGKDREIVVFRTVLSNPNTTATDLQSVLEDQLRIAHQIEATSKEINGLENSWQKIDLDSDGTEATAVRPEAIHLAEDSQADLQEYLQKNTISIGKPIDNTQIYILDKYGNLVPPGVVGELYVGGHGLAKEYLNLPELTQEKFIPNPFIEESGKNNQAKAAKLYKTGDLARWLPALKGLSRIVGDTASRREASPLGHNGNIEYLGRLDHQVKIRGFRIELGEIEAVLNTHPQVQQAIVVAREDISSTKFLAAYVVTQEKSISSDRLSLFLKQKLPEYMVPNIFVTLDTLPLTPNGKVDRKALPALNDQISRQQQYVEPRNQSEEIIANIFGDVLGRENVGIHDNFFELGGHSLLATQVISRLRDVFKIDLPLRSLFEQANVAQLAEHITATSQVVAKISPSSIPKAKGRKKIKL